MKSILALCITVVLLIGCGKEESKVSKQQLDKKEAAHKAFNGLDKSRIKRNDN